VAQRLLVTFKYFLEQVEFGKWFFNLCYKP